MDHVREIEDILGPGGVVARSIEGYEHRTQQVQMAREVFEALESGDRLIIEAPTGTGKTLAYLVGAALSRKKIAISTGTKNLQEQLFFRDFPFVRDKIFPSLKAALLKGRGNFVCHARLRRFLRQPHLQGMGGPESLDEILKWYQESCEHGQGDRSELENLPDDDPVWSEICSTTETCLGKKCSDREKCFILKMRARGADADLMIVNHHLLASDLAVRESGFGEVIPRYEALIVDEAHGLEDALTNHFGFHLSLFRILRLTRDVRAELAQADVEAERYHRVLREIDDGGRLLFAESEGLFNTGVPQRTKLKAVPPHLAEIRDHLGTNLDVLDSMLTNVPQASEDLRSLASRASGISTELGTILSAEPGDAYACWVERRDRSLMLHASPVEVGGMLGSRLYEKVPATVFTSATLSSGGNFDYFKSCLGLDQDLHPTETILDSPFDYVRQTLLYVPRGVPEPNAPGFTEAVAPVLEELLTHTGGRAFILFTSYKNMQTVHERMNGHVPFPLLIQGSKPKTSLLEEFRQRNGSVLFATSSFWEGVDVQGESLSCVIVDRLPFAPPDDPIVSARIDRIRKQGGSPFYSLQVPMAVIALKQGLGRLIRTRSDRGILCVLDVRLLTKSYGKVFRRSLYQSPLRRDAQAVEAFFSHQWEADEE